MKIIAIGAHLDDIELACGGTLAKAAKLGHKVKMVVLSHSAYTNYDGKVLRTKEQALKEGKEAAAILGVSDLNVLDFDTKEVPYSKDSVEVLDKIFSEFKPDLILTHWPFDTHQDHRNVSLATVSAARNFNSILFYEPFPPSGRSYVAFKPQVYIDISSTISQKTKSIRAHKSQLKKYGDEWIKAIEGRAKMRGLECNYEFAEVYEPLRLELKLANI